MLIPGGVKDFTPKDTQELDCILTTIESVFKKHQYQKIMTPHIEIYNTLEKAMSPSLKELCCKFFNTEGELLILRPDYTTPVCRMVATHFQDQPKPLRLYYMGPVFRNQKNAQHTDLEIFQAGIELMGESKIENDIEMISICIETLKALGFKNFTVDIGHNEFLEHEDEKQHQLLLDGDYVSYGKIPEYGKLEVIEQYPYLKEIYHQLEKKKYSKYISFNRGLVKELGYYSGIIFECYVDGIGQSIGSGGRYDHLVNKFGYDCPAVGFMLNVNLLLINQLLMNP